MKKINNSQPNVLKHFWTKDGMDYIANLGNMKKAIVVAYYKPLFGEPYYAISPRSFFPFTDEQNAVRYSDFKECCEAGEAIVLEWMKSLMVSLDSTPDVWKLRGDALAKELIESSELEDDGITKQFRDAGLLEEGFINED